MKLNTLVVLFGLLALFLLAGCPRDTGSTEGTEVVPRPTSGDQDSGNAAEAAGAIKTEQGEEQAAAEEAGAENGEAEGEGGEDMSESETTADGAAEESEAGAGEGEAPMSDEQEAGVTTVVLETTKGDIVLEVHSDWSPLGAAHFLELVKAGYFDGAPWFRVFKQGISVAQCGIAADPAVTAKWQDQTINDEPVVMGNTRGTVAFGKTPYPNSRSTHIFINLADNSIGLDPQGFACFAVVVEGLDVADSLQETGSDTVDQGRLS